MQTGANQAWQQTVLLWLLVAVVFATLLAVIAPGRGASWGDDDPMFLSMSWDAAKGFGLNLQLPQSPAYLVNAFLMKLGVQELLQFRYANYGLILMSSALFFLGLDPRRWRSPIVPVAICASLLVSLNSVANPNSLSFDFFLAGAGIYFFARDAKQDSFSLVLHGLAGAVLAIAGFMHAAVALAMAIMAVVILLVTRRREAYVLLAAFVLVSAVSWGTYIHDLGIRNFLAPPADHDAGIHYLAFRVALIIAFYLEAAAAFFAVAALAGQRSSANAHIILACAVTLFYGGSLLAYVFGSDAPPEFPLHGVFLLSSEGQWVSRVMGSFSFYLMLFAAFRWISRDWSDSIWRREIGIAQRCAQILSQTGSTLLGDVRSQKWAVALFGMILVQAALAAGSNTSISQGMVFMAGPSIGLAVVLWDGLSPGAVERRLFLVPACVLWLLCGAIFTATYNHASNEPIFAKGRIVLGLDNLHGIEETPRYRDSTARLARIFVANACGEKPFVTLIYLPGLYYFLHHPVPRDIGVVRPAFDFPEKKLRALLTADKGWCVLDASEKEIDLYTAAHGGDERQPLRNWLIANSSSSYDIHAPSPAYSNMRLYVRAAENRAK